MEEMDRNFDMYRLPWENDEHWKLRKKFLVCHQNSFAEDQLACLSQVYINIKVLGCRYSKEVMLKYVELNKILESFEYQERSPSSINTQGKRKIEDDSSDLPASDECKVSKCDSNISKLFEELSQLIIKVQKEENNPVQVLNKSFVKMNIKKNCLFKKTKNGFSCSLFMDNCLVSVGYGSKKQEAKGMAYNNAIEIICNNLISKTFENVGENVQKSVKNKKQKRTMNKLSAEKESKTLTMHKQNSNFYNIVILDDLYIDSSRTAFQVILRTASYNNVPLTFKYSNEYTTNIRCDLIFKKLFLAQATGATKQIAKNNAADIALEKLKKQTYTVMIKNNTQNDHIVSREKLQQCALGNSITENNIGYKLLQKMGWSNNNSTDSAVYSTNNDSYRRQGLGFIETAEVTKKFINQLKKIIANYASSDTDADLVFSSEFTKDERKEIHRIAEKYSLRSVSKGGKGANRHTVLSRRFKPVQLLRYLIKCGGKTDKYELLMPETNVQ